MPEEKLYSLENLVELTGGDADLISEMIHMFLSHADAFVHDFEDAIAKRDLEMLKHKAHKFKTSANLFQISELVVQLKYIEPLKDFGNMPELMLVSGKIRALTLTAAAQIKKELDNY